MSKLVQHFYDIEATSTAPHSGELIEICIITRNENKNILGKFHEKCRIVGPRIQNDVYGREVNLWPDPTGSSDPRKRNATDAHGILWEEAQHFQMPVDMYRKMWKYLKQFDEYNFELVFHSNTNFDLKWLLYRTNLHAEPLYKYIVKKTSFLEIDENGEKYSRTRYKDTMRMAQAYIRKGTDIFKEIEKQKKVITKMDGYLTKKRKTPAKPEKIKEWEDKKAHAQVTLDSLGSSQVQLKGYALNKICDSLGIKLNHHKADSDTEALLPIYDFLEPRTEVQFH